LEKKLLFTLKVKAPKNRGCQYVVAWNEGSDNRKYYLTSKYPADKISVQEAE
jgi:hypothetical protein